MIFQRGVSNVVATVVLVLLTLVALGAVSTVVMSLVRDNLPNDCFKYQDYFQFDESFDLICKDGGKYGVTVSSKAIEENFEDPIEGFTLRFVGASESYVVEVKNGMNKDLGGASFIDYDPAKTEIEIPKNGGTRSYILDSSVITYKRVQIFTKLRSGMCEQKGGEVVFVPCAVPLP